ncbi:MAG: nucleotide-binding protein [Synergistales bacterium]|nr:nucleotide-binding protein [Synergistales bacterium]
MRDLGVEPVVLENVPSLKLQALLDKLEHNISSCDYFVVLFTPDDMGYCPLKGETAKKARPRARQNVIFEAGYVARKRKQVMWLVKRSNPPIEMPSDVEGIAYHGFVSDVAEAKEFIRANLQHAGLLPTDVATGTGTP